ncbi:MAG: HK97 gp10 family phage protein [Bacillota bacterium]
MADGMRILGQKQLERLLMTLPDRVQRKATRSAVNRAATPIVKAARAGAQKQSGLLKKAINKKIKTYPAKQTVMAIIGPRRDVRGEYKGKRRVPANYAHLAESGHIDVKTGRFIPGSHFLRNAFDSQQGLAQDVLKDFLAVGIVSEAKKLGGGR